MKDESARWGLPSFKILGASWAVHQVLRRALGVNPDEWVDLAELRRRVGAYDPIELVAATDGNHGRAVAYLARLHGLAAHILVPRATAAARVLRSEGARVTVIDGSYDETVRTVAALGDELHLVVADTAWPGYEEVLRWVIDGYATVVAEADAQLGELGIRSSTLVAAQIGVGAFAAAMIDGYAGRARILGVEPCTAACVLASVEAREITSLNGTQHSIMAGLNYGTPSSVAWPTVSLGDRRVRHGRRGRPHCGLGTVGRGGRDRGERSGGPGRRRGPRGGPGSARH